MYMTSLSRQQRSEPHVGFGTIERSKPHVKPNWRNQKLVGQGIPRSWLERGNRQSNAIAQISVHEKLDLEGRKLVEGVVLSICRNQFPATCEFDGYLSLMSSFTPTTIPLNITR